MVEGGRGACGKTPVFWIYERSGCVYTEIVSDSSKATLQAIIRGKMYTHRALSILMASGASPESA